MNSLDFIILTFVYFIALKVVSRWTKKAQSKAASAADIVLLIEIHDALQSKS